jgi:hypothetical protein
MTVAIVERLAAVEELKAQDMDVRVIVEDKKVAMEEIHKLSENEQKLMCIDTGGMNLHYL